jgi:hypothetical protein
MMMLRATISVPRLPATGLICCTASSFSGSGFEFNRKPTKLTGVRGIRQALQINATKILPSADMKTSFIRVNIRNVVNWFGKVGINLAENRKKVPATKGKAIGKKKRGGGLVVVVALLLSGLFRHLQLLKA